MCVYTRFPYSLMICRADPKHLFENYKRVDYRKVLSALMDCLSPTHVRTQGLELVEHECMLKQLMILTWPLGARVDARTSMYLARSASSWGFTVKELSSLKGIPSTCTSHDFDSPNVNLNPQPI